MADLGDPDTWLPGEAALDVIRAEIAAYNAERPAIARAQSRRVLLMMGGFVLVAAAVLVAAISSGNSVVAGLGIAFAIFGGQFVWSKATAPARAFRQALRNRLFPAIFGFIPEFSYTNGQPPRFLPGLERTGMLTWHSAGHDDGFAGIHDGMAFELAETEFSPAPENTSRACSRG